jgi:hypothetical protein
MREDMHEVIIERPRWGSRTGHFRRARRFDPKRAAAVDPDGLPFGMAHRRGADLGYHTKSLSENLAPLRRYLARQVNRPWDKVWSDISANLKATNTVQQHVRDHVGDFVAIRSLVKDGVVLVVDRVGRPTPLTECRQQLYVDPRTGILRRNKHYKRHAQRHRDDMAAAARDRAPRMRELAPLLQLHRLKDCWWVVTLAPVSYSRHGRVSGPDVVIGAAMTALPAEELYGRRDVYAVTKRQLTSAEIVACGLRD